MLSSTVKLQDQVDGVRSFVSIIFQLMVNNTSSILILDEPEAFLHPPQARLLGEYLSKERSGNRQLIIATHSPHVLEGLLTSFANRLRVLRIRRDSSKNVVMELDKARAIEISKDPLMRYSNVLSGVFHESVIICEADTDCLFYSSILNIRDIHGGKVPDVLFVHAGGKQRLHTLSRALKDLGVPVDVIVDIDILNDMSEFERLFRSLGGDWSVIKSQGTSLKSAIEDARPWSKAGQIVEKIEEVLRGIANSREPFPKKASADIQSILRTASPWDAVKGGGERGIPQGNATRLFTEVRQQCSKIGLWIVPVGQVEGFCRSVDNTHGPKWAQEVLQSKNLESDVELKQAREFVRQIWESRLV